MELGEEGMKMKLKIERKRDSLQLRMSRERAGGATEQMVGGTERHCLPTLALTNCTLVTRWLRTGCSLAACCWQAH